MASIGPPPPIDVTASENLFSPSLSPSSRVAGQTHSWRQFTMKPKPLYSMGGPANNVFIWALDCASISVDQFCTTMCSSCTSPPAAGAGAARVSSCRLLFAFEPDTGHKWQREQPAWRASGWAQLGSVGVFDFER